MALSAGASPATQTNYGRTDLPDAKAQAMKSNAERKKQFLATLTAAPCIVSLKTVEKLNIHFQLKNISKEKLDPKITESELIVDGKELPDSAFLFGNGPRDARFTGLPPGEALHFTYALGSKFTKAGIYTLGWRGKNFEAEPITFTVTAR